MPSPEPLQPYRRVQGQAERDLSRILEATAKRIRRRVERLPVGIGGEIRAAQLRLVLSEIRRLQRVMWRDQIDGVTQAAVDAAVEAGESAIETMTRVAYAALPEDVADALVDGLRLSAQSGLKSDAARRKRELSSRVWKQESLHSGKVEDLIRQGLISGLSAKELARDVYEHVSPSTPGGASYAAMRLARTEINNAFHERQLEGANRPGVTAVKWNLSGSHKVPDKCNVYAAHGGNGHWPKDEVPEKPHPQCFCFLTYVMMEAGKFADAFERGDFDDEIDRRTKEKLARLAKQDPKPPAKPEPKRKRTVPHNRDIERSFKSGIARQETLYGGAIASTRRLEFNDGTEGVSKVVFDLSENETFGMSPEDLDNIPTAKEQQDAEELGPLLARAMGLKAPQVYRPRETETVQQFMEGRVAGDIVEAEIEDPNGVLDQYRDTDQGWLIGLLDQVIGNNDRNDGNWLVDDEGNLIPIDHGSSWQPLILQRYEGKPVPGYQTLFGPLFMDSTNSVDAKWIDNDLSPADIDALRDIMTVLWPEFEKRGQQDWWGWSMSQIDAIGRHAKGTKRRIK